MTDLCDLPLFGLWPEHLVGEAETSAYTPLRSARELCSLHWQHGFLDVFLSDLKSMAVSEVLVMLHKDAEISSLAEPVERSGKDCDIRQGCLLALLTKSRIDELVFRACLLSSEVLLIVGDGAAPVEVSLAAWSSLYSPRCSTLSNFCFKAEAIPRSNTAVTMIS